MNRWLRYSVKASGIIAVGMALGFVAGSWIFAGRLIAPVPSKVAWPVGLAYSPEDVSFKATDGVNLRGWLLPQAGSTQAVVVLHGVCANRDSMLARAFWLRSLGYNVLVYDARGCGESAPVARSFGYDETRDLLGALSWLQSRGMTRIGCIGCSQGAATILLASGRLPPSVRAVVAEASYTTLRATVDDHFREHTRLPSSYFGALIVPFAEWKLGMNINDVSPLREISKLKAPIYLIGGGSDTLAPPAGTHQLFEAARGEKYLWMVGWAGHADFFSYAEDQYKQRIGEFLRNHL